MNNFFTTTLTILGGIFLILLLVGAGYWVSMSLQPTPTKSVTEKSTTTETTDTEAGTATEPTTFTLSEAQKSALSSFGIDPASVPSTITATQEACFTTELGANRVAEIKGGATPTAIDFLKVKNCL